jgi:hypothetical protein
MDWNEWKYESECDFGNVVVCHCVVGTRVQQHLKIVIKTPISEILSYTKKEVFYKNIYEIKPACVKR